MTRFAQSSGVRRRAVLTTYNRAASYTMGQTVLLNGTSFTARAAAPVASVPPAGQFAIPYPDTNGFTPAAWKAAGGTHIRVQAFWDRLQLAQGAALDPTALATLNSRISTSIAAGLQVILEIHLATRPSWLTSSVVPDYKNQSGEAYGGDVLDYIWTAAGRTVVSDFVRKVLAGASMNSVSAMLLGGGPLNELHYPSPLGKTPAISFWSFGAAAQTGTGLAAGQVVCPIPGYVYSGNGSANDATISAWHLGGIRNWLKWLISEHRTGYAGLIYVMHPDVGIRTTRPLSDTAMVQQVAAGTDWAGQMDAYPDQLIAPWCTWLDSTGTDSTEANQAPWAKLYDLALARGRAGRISGENAAGTSTAGLQAVFASGGAMAYGYRIYCHVGWDALNAGGSNATLATLQSIVVAPSTVWGLTSAVPPADTTPPASVTNYSFGLASARDIAVAWSNPSDPDFAGIEIRYLAGSTNPTTSTGTLVTTGAKLVPDDNSYVDGSGNHNIANNLNFVNDVLLSGLSIGTTYKIGVWAVDTSGNRSVPVFGSVTTPVSETSPNGVPGDGLSVFPYSGNTGWQRTGVPLTTVLKQNVSASGTGWSWDGGFLTISASGTSTTPLVFSGFDIQGGCTISGSWVVLQNSRIRATGLDYHTFSTTNLYGSNITVQDCEIGGGDDGITYICGPNATFNGDTYTNKFLRTNIHHLADGGKTNNGAFYKDCWVHNMPTDQANNIHSDGLQWGSSAGAGPSLVEHCTYHGGDYTDIYIEYVGIGGQPTIRKNLLLASTVRNSSTVTAVAAGHDIGNSSSVLTITDNMTSPNSQYVLGVFRLDIASNGTTVVVSGNVDTSGVSVTA